MLAGLQLLREHLDLENACWIRAFLGEHLDLGNMLLVFIQIFFWGVEGEWQI
jgi:hypothetical protein